MGELTLLKPALARTHHGATAAAVLRMLARARFLRAPALWHLGVVPLGGGGRHAGGRVRAVHVPEAVRVEEGPHHWQASAEDGDGGLEVEPHGWGELDPSDVRDLRHLDEDDEADDVEDAGAVGFGQ